MKILKNINYKFMEILNLNKILDQYGIENSDELAKMLFPTVRYPEFCFRRILKGESSLDSYQISILANYLQVPVSELFTVKDTDWHATQKNNQLIFRKGDYKVALASDMFKLSIYKGQDNFYNSVGSVGLMTVQEFLKTIDNIIKEFESKNSHNN